MFSSIHPLKTQPNPPSPSKLSDRKFLVAFLTSMNVKELMVFVLETEKSTFVDLSPRGDFSSLSGFESDLTLLLVFELSARKESLIRSKNENDFTCYKKMSFRTVQTLQLILYNRLNLRSLQQLSALHSTRNSGNDEIPFYLITIILQGYNSN